MSLLGLNETPYRIQENVAEVVAKAVSRLQDETGTLRNAGKLTPETLQNYYNDTRLEDITESNAIEGSTLSIQETELAVRRITVTGHDPAFIRDARTLYEAFTELATIAKSKSPTNIDELKRIHEIILAGQGGAGVFRTDEVRIRGAKHVPPRTWKEVISGMEHWEQWSIDQKDLPTPLRAAILHAWLTHIHPFQDGNGRTSRAITTLELVRGGFPPVVIRKKDQIRYYDALAEADQGDIGPFLELLLGRLRHAQDRLFRVAKERQGFDPIAEKVKSAQQNRYFILNTAIENLIATIQDEIQQRESTPDVSIAMRTFFSGLDVEDFLDLYNGKAISQSWVCSVTIHVGGVGKSAFLSWLGYSSDESRHSLKFAQPHLPALYWSIPNPAGYPKWMDAPTEKSPGGTELIYSDRGWSIHTQGTWRDVTVRDLAHLIVKNAIEMTLASPNERR